MHSVFHLQLLNKVTSFLQLQDTSKSRFGLEVYADESPELQSHLKVFVSTGRHHFKKTSSSTYLQPKVQSVNTVVLCKLITQQQKDSPPALVYVPSAQLLNTASMHSYSKGYFQVTHGP